MADLITVSGDVGSIAGALLGPEARPRRALLLDKSPEVNWRLGWHQDRTISVQRRIDVPGFTAWSVKSGQLHVQPPQEITQRMITLRIHLDRVDQDNAPLRVLAGSHRLGRLTNEQVEKAATDLAEVVCLAEAGDVWAYNTAIVHASGEQQSGGRRRVLQLDYSADELPGGLEWAVGEDYLYD
ncbi:phytanoyl-CoA dioxygenase family protein [Sphingomonas piscis]|uniref:phytanoyl-CoA dioxygenase family protein n=1 Tax=Sphingomonas piscis TaxID=2714943 RepID=UPI0019D2A436|nr:phytanoyl-CoA dioxygenase family protein [Sphingomonas piscis]